VEELLGLFAEGWPGAAGTSASSRRATTAISFKAGPGNSTPLNLRTNRGFAGSSNFGNYDFSEEVNVEVAGAPVSSAPSQKLEKLRVGGLFCPQSPARKNRVRTAHDRPRPEKEREARADGSRPLEDAQKRPAQALRHLLHRRRVTGLIVERTVDALVRERFDALQTKYKVDPKPARTKTPRSFSRTGPPVLRT